MTEITASVGKGGTNREADVILVQQLLNQHVPALGFALLVVDGDAGDNTIKAIKKYQKQVVGIAAPDGRIDPGGRTWQALSGSQLVQPPTQGSDAGSLSGAAWWHANQANFPNSAMLADLTSPFREKVVRFTGALRDAGARISVSATRRNRTRAHLMHFCWKIAKGLTPPAAVPPIEGCAIKWEHGDLAKSRRGAREMVDLFGIAFQPSLTSLHVQGRAIDMTIGWTGTLRIADADGAVHAIGAPRNGNTNARLHAVGRTYGVIKLASDPPHWSDNGH